MSENTKSKKRTTDEIIAETAKSTVASMVDQLRKARVANLYSATERLLRNYPKLRAQVENIDDYGFIPGARSKDISVAPPPGGGVVDHNELIERAIADRQASYDRTYTRFLEIDSVVRQFQDTPEFIIIRMYYWNLDARGNPRDPESQPYTFEEISSELTSVGIQRSVKTLRSWRTKLVQDMAVCLFGIDGAISVESSRFKRSSAVEPGASEE